MMPVQDIDSLLEAYAENAGAKNPERLSFEGVGGFDVYNPSKAFLYDGVKTLCGRVEKRDSENSRAVFFHEVTPGTYRRSSSLPEYQLQDPFVTRVHDLYVFGGTKVTTANGQTTWFTRIYYGPSLENLRHLADAPEGMKDVRLVGLDNGRIGIFTRPQGDKGGRGMIGFTVVEGFGAVTRDVMDTAPVLKQVPSDHWVGANDAILLKDGTIGVLGHVAVMSEGQTRHYYPMAFTLDLETVTPSPMSILATRNDFLEGPSKRTDLKDVLFTGGMQREGNRAILYCGVSDCEIQTIDIPYPFDD